MVSATHSSNQFDSNGIRRLSAQFVMVALSLVILQPMVLGEGMSVSMIRDIQPGAESSMRRSVGVHMQHISLNGTLFFDAEDGAHGRELWKSDGTAEGSVMVKDIRSGSVGSEPLWLASVGGTCFFSAQSSDAGVELWKSDGTAAGTVMVKDINPTGNSYPSNLTNVGGLLFFAANDGTHGLELWKSDGTPEGTVMVKDIRAGNGSAGLRDLTAVGESLFFAADDGVHGPELWKSNGADSGTVMVKDFFEGRNYGPDNLTEMNGRLYCTTNDGKIWQSDGTEEGTVIVSENRGPSRLTNINGTLYFTASYSSRRGGSNELWLSDGTSEGTRLVWPPRNTHELWLSDGTSEGTRLVGPPRNTQTSFEAEYLTNVNGSLFFTSKGELWKSTPGEGVTGIRGGLISGPFSEAIARLFVVNGTAANGAAINGTPVNGVYFLTPRGDISGFLVRVREELSPGASRTAITSLTNVDGRLFFTATDDEHGNELWTSDGTRSGTVLVGDIRAGSGSSSPSHLTAHNGTLFFTADDGANGRELWKVGLPTPSDPPALTVETSATSVPEGGAGSLLTVTRLHSDTSESLTVSLAVSAAGQVSVPATAEIPGGEASATISFTPVDDQVDDEDQVVTITATAVNFEPVSADISILDNDTAGITVSPMSGLTTSEAGRTDSFTVTLDSEPTSEVTIRLASGNSSEGTTSPQSLLFNPQNWNIPQAVTVVGVDDHQVDGDQQYTISVQAESSDGKYHGMLAPSVSVTNEDDDRYVFDELPLDTTLGGNAGPQPVEYAYYRLEMTAGARYVIETSASSTLPQLTDTVLYLCRNWSGQTGPSCYLAYNDDGGPALYSRITFSAGVSGFYYLKVRGYGRSTGHFNIRVTEERYEFGDLALGTTAEGYSGPTRMNYAYYRVPLEAGNRYLIETSAPTSGNRRLRDTVLSVWRGWSDASGPQGYLAYNDDGGQGLYSLIEFSPTTSGYFYLTVSGYHRQTGHFGIKVSRQTSQFAFEDLALNTTVQGHAGRTRAEYAYYRVQLEAGTSYNIETSAPSASTTNIYETAIFLYRGWSDVSGPDNCLAYNDSSGVGRYSRIRFSARSTGDFYLMVRGNSGRTGCFDIRVTPEHYEFTDLPDDTTISGTAGRVRPDYAYFKVRMDTGYYYTIETSRPSGQNQILRDTVLYVYQRWSDSSGPSGLITLNDDGGEGLYSRIRIRPRVSGDHYLMVRGYGGQTGQFNIRIFQERYEFTDLPTDTVVESYAGSRSLDYAYFRVQMESGLNYNIETSAATDGRRLRDTVLSVYRGWSEASGPNRCLAYNDDGGVGLYSKLNFRPASTGTYYLQVKGYWRQTGNFRIQVTAPQPDLVVTSVVANPAIVNAGDSTILSAAIRNDGDGPANDSEVSVTLNDESITTIRIGRLEAGRTVFFNHPLQNIQASPREQTVTVTADSGNGLHESDEANNSRSATVTVAGKPDLVVEGLSVTSTRSSQGVQWRVRFRIRNVGNGTADESIAGLYIENQFFQGPIGIRKLEPGEDQQIQVQVVPPANASPTSEGVGSASAPSPSQEGNEEVDTPSDIPVGVSLDTPFPATNHNDDDGPPTSGMVSVTFTVRADESNNVDESDEENNENGLSAPGPGGSGNGGDVISIWEWLRLRGGGRPTGSSPEDLALWMWNHRIATALEENSTVSEAFETLDAAEEGIQEETPEMQNWDAAMDQLRRALGGMGNTGLPPIVTPPVTAAP